MGIRKGILALLAALCLCGLAAAEEFDGYIVKLRPREDTMATLSLSEAEKLQPVEHVPEVYLVEDEADVARLQALGLVEYAEPNYILETMAAPNDPQYAAQWDLPAIGFEALWNSGYDGTGTTVAMIDSGLHTSHEEFASAKISVHSKNFLGDGTHPEAYTRDQEGHGSFVAGRIAPQTGNGTGIAGPAHGAELMVLRCATKNETVTVPYSEAYDYGSGGVTRIASAFHHAADNGADVINISMGTTKFLQTLQDAVTYAQEKGVVVVASAGNGANGDLTSLYYPAAFDGVIGVGSVSKNGDTVVRSAFSQYNASVDFVSPGGSVLGIDLYPDGVNLYTDCSQTYLAGSGTSYAAPVVTALASICKQTDALLDSGDVQALLAVSAVDYGTAGRDDYYGYGVVNAEKLLTALTETDYAISYELNADDALLPEGSAASYQLDRTTDVVLPVPVRQGYTFCGWYADSACSGSAVAVVPKGTLGALQAAETGYTIGPVTYYAKWEADSAVTADAEDFALTFFIKESLLSQNGSAVVTHYLAHGREPEKTEVLQAQWTAVDGGWEITVPLAAKELMDPVTVEILDGNGNLLAFVEQTAANALRSRISSGVKYAAVLNYAAAAQAHFNYNAAMPADWGLDTAAYLQAQMAQLPSLRQDTSTCTDSSVILGSSLLLEDPLQMKFYFALAEDMTVLVGGQTVAGSAAAVTVTDLFAPVQITVLQGENVVAEGADSAASYLARLYAAGHGALADAVLLYGLTGL